VSGLAAVMYREGKIRATNAVFIFWDVIYPLGYLLVFSVGMNTAVVFSALPTNYHAFFLAGVLGMAGFGIASNTAWSFFMDRDPERVPGRQGALQYRDWARAGCGDGGPGRGHSRCAAQA
jgi:hypothetical protein